MLSIFFTGDEDFRENLLMNLEKQMCDMNSTLNALGICSMPEPCHEVVHHLQNQLMTVCSTFEDHELTGAYLHGDNLKKGFVPRDETAERIKTSGETATVPPLNYESDYVGEETAAKDDTLRETALSQVRRETRGRAETEKKNEQRKKVKAAKIFLTKVYKQRKQDMFNEMIKKDPTVKIFGTFDKWYQNEQRAKKGKTILDFKRSKPNSAFATVIDEHFVQGSELTQEELEKQRRYRFRPDTEEEAAAKQQEAEQISSQSTQLARKHGLHKLFNENLQERRQHQEKISTKEQEKSPRAMPNFAESPRPMPTFEASPRRSNRFQPKSPQRPVPVQMFKNMSNVSFNFQSSAGLYEPASSPQRSGETARPKRKTAVVQNIDDESAEDSYNEDVDDTDKDADFHPDDEDQQEEEEEEYDSDLFLVDPPEEKAEVISLISPEAQENPKGAKQKSTKLVKPQVKTEPDDVKPTRPRGKKRRSSLDELKEQLEEEKEMYKKPIKKEKKGEKKKGNLKKLLGVLKGMMCEEDNNSSEDEDSSDDDLSDEALIKLCTNKKNVVNWEKYYMEKKRLTEAKRKTGYKKKKPKRRKLEEVELLDDSSDETAKTLQKKKKPAYKPDKTAIKREKDDKTATEELVDLKETKKQVLKNRHERNKKIALKGHICSVCRKRFRSQSELNEHEPIHIDEDVYKCECGKPFNWPKGRTEHQRKGICWKGKELLEKGEIPPLHEEWQCPYCEKTKPREHLLQEHLSKEHPKEMKKKGEKPTFHYCPKCNKRFTSLNSALQHIERDTCLIKMKLRCKLCKIKNKKHQCRSEEFLRQHLKHSHFREMMKFVEAIDSLAASLIRENIPPALVCHIDTCAYSTEELHLWISHLQLHHTSSFVELLTDVFGDIFSEEPPSDDD